jgi:hypothetical protein
MTWRGISCRPYRRRLEQRGARARDGGRGPQGHRQVHHLAGGSLRTSTRTEIGRARRTHLQGEISYHTTQAHAQEEEREVQHRLSACSQQLPCQVAGLVRRVQGGHQRQRRGPVANGIREHPLPEVRGLAPGAYTRSLFSST